jgi:predicted RND superfamily exporter protein
VSARYAAWLRRRAGAVVVGAALLTALAVALAARLTISTDLAAVLPRGYASVEDLHRLIRRMGGTASLTVVVESPSLAANERFADDLAARLRGDLGPDLANLDYKVDALRRFYEQHAAVYLSKEALAGIERDLDEAMRAGKRAASPLPYDLELDGPGPSADAKLDQIDQRIREAQREFDRYPDGYFAGEGGRLLALFLRPRGSGADPATARAFIGRVQAAVDALGPARYHPALRVSYTGAYQISLDEQAAITHDLVSTAGLCVGLIALAVTLYFRRLRAMALLGVTLACGCAWAFGLARLTVGYLNIQTAFLGSIIAGTGINYGIILLSRYLEARGGGASEAAALEAAIGDTFVATLTAAATTAVSFGTLLVARISSFRHFAVIGGGGILFCWILSFTLLPALLVLSDRLLPVGRRRAPPLWPACLARLPVERPRLVASAALALAVLGALGFSRFLPSVLETDGRNLRNKSSSLSGAARLDERVSRLRGDSLTPGFVVTDSLGEARRVCRVLNARVRALGRGRAPLDECRSIDSLLPDEQEAKLAIARRLAHKLDALPERSRAPTSPSAQGRLELPEKTRARLERLRARIDLSPVTLASLPDELVRPFREVTGEVGRLVAVYPPRGRDLWIAENLFAFTNAVRRIDLGDGRVVTSSGDAVIFADILREIARDAPRTTALALAGVVLFVLLALRGRRGTLHVVGALVVGVVWMLGLQAALAVKLNFFNFVALPTTFGIAVDYAINVYARYQRTPGAPAEALKAALRHVGGAVFLCSLTTIIGYATLIIADNRALVSFGELAIVGELSCVVASLFVLPATVRLDCSAQLSAAPDNRGARAAA